MASNEKKALDIAEFAEVDTGSGSQEVKSEGSFDDLNETEIKALEKKRSSFCTFGPVPRGLTCCSGSEDRSPSHSRPLRSVHFQYPRSVKYCQCPTGRDAKGSPPHRLAVPNRCIDPGSLNMHETLYGRSANTA